jgi:hypothetical protein
MEFFMSIFEIIMLICFGTAWPVSILKSGPQEAITVNLFFYGNCLNWLHGRHSAQDIFFI